LVQADPRRGRAIIAMASFDSAGEQSMTDEEDAFDRDRHQR
jgi:hypothetical protein